MNNILNHLEKMNFTKTEAAVYLDLLKNSSLTGYQIAKNLNISRSSVYSALDNLYKKGVVFLLPGNIQVYKAENPSVLMNKMKKEFNDNADWLEKQLNQLNTSELEERYLNIKGYDNVVTKAKELLKTAEKEVYINTDFNLEIFSKEFWELHNKGVRIIVFTFSKLNTENLPIEIFSNSHNIFSQDKETRMMLVVDFKATLMAGIGKNKEEFIGTFTENTLLTSIISEHIHNDIYLLKLKNKYNYELIDEEIKIDTLIEKR